MDNDILKELQKTNKLLSMILVEKLVNREKFKTLYNIGYSPKEIAEMLGTTRNTVSVALNQLNKKKRKQK
jgi:DNA-binding MarR family transcriptional regulator